MAQYLTPQIVARQPNTSITWNLVDTVATLSQVTASGYLDNLQALGNYFDPQDLFYIVYNGGSGWFSPTFSANIITLSAFPPAQSQLFNPNYLDGFLIVYATTTTLTLNTGSCVDSTNAINIVLGTNQTINMATNGANGLDIGTFTASSMYAIYVIADSTGVNSPKGLASLNASSPTLPAGYNKFRFVGLVYSNSSTQLYEWTAKGNARDKDFFVDNLGTQIVLSSGTATTQTTIGTLTTFVPNNGKISKLKFIAQFNPATATDYARVSPHGFNIASNGASVILGAGVAEDFVCPFEIEPGASFQIDYLVDHSGSGNSALTLSIVGFTLSL